MSANGNIKCTGTDLMAMDIADLGDMPNVCRTSEITAMCQRLNRILLAH